MWACEGRLFATWTGSHRNTWTRSSTRSIGGGVLTASAGAARSGGRLASIAEPCVTGSLDVFARMDRADLTAVTALAEAGLLSVRVGAVFPLEKAAEAQRAFATGNITGKVVLEIG
ncbi:zinc-binding dehydrogenase [Streptomyces prunicolor]